MTLTLKPFDLESGVRVTCDVGYLCARCTRQTSGRRQTKASLNASVLWRRRHNNNVQSYKPRHLRCCLVLFHVHPKYTRTHAHTQYYIRSSDTETNCGTNWKTNYNSLGFRFNRTVFFMTLARSVVVLPMEKGSALLQKDIFTNRKPFLAPNRTKARKAYIFSLHESL